MTEHNTSGGLTEGEREALRGLGQGQVPAVVERIVAERVRVVEGERDAARAEAAEMSDWIEEHALVKTYARIADWQEATGAELPGMARAAMHAYAARAESAEAALAAEKEAHAGLWAGVEGLVRSWSDEAAAGRAGNGHPLLVQTYDGHARDLRALLVGGGNERREVHRDRLPRMRARPPSLQGPRLPPAELHGPAPHPHSRAVRGG